MLAQSAAETRALRAAETRALGPLGVTLPSISRSDLFWRWFLDLAGRDATAVKCSEGVRRRWFERKRCSPSLPLAIYWPLSHIRLRRCALLGGEGSPNHVGVCFGGETRSKPLSPGSSTWCGVMSSKLRRPLVLCEGGRVAEAGHPCLARAGRLGCAASVAVATLPVASSLTLGGH